MQEIELELICYSNVASLRRTVGNSNKSINIATFEQSGAEQCSVFNMDVRFCNVMFSFIISDVSFQLEFSSEVISKVSSFASDHRGGRSSLEIDE